MTNPDPINPIPAANSNFLSDLQRFLNQEDGDRLSELFGITYVDSGGTHGTAAGLTGTPTSLVSYINGLRITETGSIIYPDNDTTWVVATQTTTGSPGGNFVRVAGTHYAIDSVSATQPSLPGDSTWLMKVVTAGGAITAVTDLRNLSSFPFDALNGVYHANRYGSLSEVVTLIGGSNATLVFDRAFTVEETVSTPANVHIVVMGGGAISVSSTYTLTINDPEPELPLRTVFSGAGAVLFGAAKAMVWAEWFGGTGNAIQTAIDAFGSNPGTVQLEHDTYTLTSARLVARYSGQRIVGRGWGSVIEWAGTPPAGVFGGTQGMITAYPSDASYPGTPGTAIEGIEIRDLRITGLGEAVYTVGKQGIQFENVKDGLIENCYVGGASGSKNFGAENIIMDASFAGTQAGSGNVVRDCYIKGGGNFWNPGNSFNTTFTGNFVDGTDFQSAEISLSGHTVTDNTFRKVSGSILLYGQSSTSTTEESGILFADNLLDQCAAAGGTIAALTVTQQGTVSKRPVTVDNNIIVKSGGKYGILVSCAAGATMPIVISRNTVTETATASTSGIGILSSNTAPNVEITGNRVYPGVAGDQIRGISCDVNSLAHVHGNYSDGHSADDYQIQGSATAGWNDDGNGSHLGLGTALTRHLSATAALDFDLTATASQDLTITVTGAALGDTVYIGVPNGSVTADTLFWGWVSAANTVTIRAMRIAGTPNPASGTFRADVWQH